VALKGELGVSDGGMDPEARGLLNTHSLLLYAGWLEERDRSVLKPGFSAVYRSSDPRVVGSAIKERARASNGRDEALGSDDPTHTPTRQAEALCEAVDDDDRVLCVSTFVSGGLFTLLTSSTCAAPLRLSPSRSGSSQYL
jgi:hypothetical protein